MGGTPSRFVQGIYITNTGVGVLKYRREQQREKGDVGNKKLVLRRTHVADWIPAS